MSEPLPSTRERDDDEVASRALPWPLARLAERAIAVALAVDPDTRERLRDIDAAVVRVCLERPGMTFAVAIVDERIDVLAVHDGEVDVTISGTPAALLSLQQGREALYSGDVRIEGDVGTAQQLSDIVSELDIDLEELIAPLLGGSLAHRIGRLGQNVGSWLQRTQSNLRVDVADYLVEEKELLTPTDQVSEFAADVDELRLALDRLEARVRRVERQRASSS